MKKSENCNISSIYVKIKELLKTKKVTYNELADMVGFTRPTVANWFKGTSKIDVDTLPIIAQKLNVPVSYFYDNSENNTIPNSTSDREQLLKELVKEKDARIILLEEKIKMLELIGKKTSVPPEEDVECADAVG
ncbi:helix-turn-helix transcriptional regulator [uncultured Sanguibacteroides sp.]|uniref:helix-turn-helix domain-containing protein n=1 Tax=uncultured Sanguibacteroides sp. TaxID=1635151 RepID=UPI0025EC8612|nr:helix-turn-helix transcriptional regulator [uncultured Sanguibacteroides sp.]